MKSQTETLAYWINERERIRIAKTLGHPKPWTDDAILQKYRFCNVRREDDRVTQWLRKHWRNPFYDHPNLTLAMALARFLNWPPTLEELGFPDRWRPERVLQILSARKARGEKIWNNAYMITTCGKEIDKNKHLVNVLNWVHTGQTSPVSGDNLATAWAKLTSISGIGGFLAAQIVADLKYAHLNPLAKANDWWTWAAPGAGSERGLRWFMERERSVPKAMFLVELHRMIEQVSPLLPPLKPPLHAQDWQSVCCEMSKYVKALAGGRPKQNYITTEGEYTL